MIDFGIEAARNALDIDLSSLHDRSPAAGTYLSLFPGEHYRLLASIVKILQPELIVEVGTYTGLSALAMLATLPRHGRLITYDLIPWNQINESALRPSDFADDRLEQRIGNLAEPGFFDSNRDVLRTATLFFLDGPKDGYFEPALTRLLRSLPRERRALLVFDDVRIWKMLSFWRDLQLPKLDLTSFGHWEGTGLAYLPERPRSATI